MKCEKCGEDNPAGPRFCRSCMQPFPVACLSCGFDNSEGSSYCSRCGAQLQAPGSGPPSGERRQLTVLFCDLVGSTELSQTMDPEDLQELLAAYHKVCADAVAVHEGHIAQYLGDGVVMFFGYPRAHEDEAQRAVRCGLDILDGVRKLSEEQPRMSVLSVRLGAHTGRVVVGAVDASGRQISTAVGDTPNMAARIQVEAPVGALLVSSITWGLVEGYFTGEDLGERALKGFAQPAHLWRVTGRGTSHDRVEVAARLTPFVGREEERQALLDAWQAARQGTSRFVLIASEPGMGKSRLVQWFREQLEGDASQVLMMRASPYSSSNPFFPLIELIQHRFGVRPGDPDAERLDSLERALEARGLLTAEVVGLLGPLLSVPTERRYPPLDLSPARRRAQTMQLLIDLAVRLTSAGPTILIGEDLHWADPSTLEFVERFVQLAPPVPLLGVFTARPELEPKWTTPELLRLIELSKLDRPKVEAIVRHVALNKPLPSEVLRQSLPGPKVFHFLPRKLPGLSWTRGFCRSGRPAGKA